MKLSDFDHLRGNRYCRFKEEIVSDSHLTIISYMVADNDYWKIPLSEETRGIVFETKSGLCICRPFEKFFNIGENEYTQSHSLDWSQGFIVNEKIDGSMVTPVLLPSGIIKFKTKKTFYNEISRMAERRYFLLPIHTQQKIYDILESGYTPIFEFTSPENRVVVNHSSSDLWLLGIRNNHSGKYIELDPSLGELEGIRFPRKFTFTKEGLFSHGEKLSGMEGFVVTFSDGRRVKLKTKWYMSLHRIMTDIRERDVAEAVIDETFDDIVSEISREAPERLQTVLDIRDSVMNWFSSIYDEVYKCVSSVPVTATPKEVSEKFRDHRLFDLIISDFRGKDISPLMKKKFMKEELHRYSLRSLGQNF